MKRAHHHEEKAVRLSHRIVVATLAALALAAPAGSAAIDAVGSAAPVIVLTDKQFGRVLATGSQRALYYWNVEKRAGGKVRCTGQCAKVWPPLIVPSAASVPAHVPGITGTFGVIKRPEGRLQVTYNRLPVYTYAHEGPNQVLCDNVNGWFVVRV